MSSKASRLQWVWMILISVVVVLQAWSILKIVAVLDVIEHILAIKP